jgi:hypothetical protein
MSVHAGMDWFTQRKPPRCVHMCMGSSSALNQVDLAVSEERLLSKKLLISFHTIKPKPAWATADFSCIKHYLANDILKEASKNLINSARRAIN